MQRTMLFVCFTIVLLSVLDRGFSVPLWGSFFALNNNDDDVKTGKTVDQSAEQRISVTKVAENNKLTKDESISLSNQKPNDNLLIRNEVDSNFVAAAAAEESPQHDSSTADEENPSGGYFRNVWRKSMKKISNGGKKLYQKTIDGVRKLNDKSFDAANYVIDSSTDATVSKLDEYAEMMDTYRNLLSGLTKNDKPAKGHRFSIITESSRPYAAINNVVNSLPTQISGGADGTGLNAEIEDIDIDFSSFLF